MKVVYNIRGETVATIEEATSVPTFEDGVLLDSHEEGVRRVLNRVYTVETDTWDISLDY